MSLSNGSSKGTAVIPALKYHIHIRPFADQELNNLNISPSSGSSKGTTVVPAFKYHIHIRLFTEQVPNSLNISPSSSGGKGTAVIPALKYHIHIRVLSCTGSLSEPEAILDAKPIGDVDYVAKVCRELLGRNTLEVSGGPDSAAP
ncbi:hypothetical protein DL771_009754 [Monosporascus sp. 5C6A]|nr:hypothetical protein DL771_009754 [Monosporascus sp. 5C6A]